jgi:hypothetical protein
MNTGTRHFGWKPPYTPRLAKPGARFFASNPKLLKALKAEAKPPRPKRWPKEPRR